MTRAVRLGALLSALFAPLQLSAQTGDSLALRGARRPAFSATNVLAFERDGHLYTVAPGGRDARQVTSGSASHRDATWAPNALYFASDSLGSYDIWRLPVDTQGVPTGPAQPVTSGPGHDVAPSVATDGRLVFQRGLGRDARIWLRTPDGQERRLSDGMGVRRPRFSPDGTRVGYLSAAEGTATVVLHRLANNSSTSFSVSRGLEDFAWAPDGVRVLVSTQSDVFVEHLNWTGARSSVATVHGDVAWSPDGSTLAIAQFAETNVTYNGDPERGVDRSSTDRPSPTTTRLFTMPAPPPLDDKRQAVVTTLPTSRAASNAAAFDRVWNRSDRLYFAAAGAEPRRAAWRAVRERYRPQAVAAVNDSVLQQVIHQALSARPPLREEATGRAAVSSAHPVATEAGLAMFRRGGNVVDAAVAVSFALGVVEPDASGIGGYGEMVIALKGQSPTLIEFMSRVPEEGGLSNTGLLTNGRYPVDGPVLVNIPGTVHGMYTAWQRYGSRKVTWTELLEPAIQAAAGGYVVSEGLATTLATEREHFAKYEGSRALFFRDGQPKVAGDTVKNPDLAWVLEQIAAKGADGFYKGEVARKYAGDLRAKGNAMKVSDLERYFANEREPVCGTYRRYRVCSSAPPVSGGAELVARLNLLEQFTAPKSYRDDPATLHAALSAWFLVPSSRGKIADPALWPVDVASLVHKDTAAVRWRCHDAGKALTPASVRGEPLACLAAPTDTAKPAPGAPPGHGEPFADDEPAAEALSPCGDDHAAEMTWCHAAGTTAFTVADADGSAVAVTQTLGTWGGNFYVTPGLGFLSNDKLTSYGTDPTQYGSRLPFARHGSTLAPTIAFKDGRPVFAVGAAGNAWITSAVYQTLLGALDYGLGPQAALELPRFLPGGGFGGGAAASGAAGGTRAPARPQPYTLQLEDGFAPQVISRLRTLGYELSFISARGELREGYGAAVRIDGRSVTAGADPRRAGAAGAVPR